MGMFDWYEPHDPMSCPHCHEVLSGWQGKDGPNALLLWREGSAAPADQLVDPECRGQPSVIQALRLPDVFGFYTNCPCGAWLEATGFCRERVWSETALGDTPSRASVPALDLSGDWRQCSRCAEAWSTGNSIALAVCPGCSRLTELAVSPSCQGAG